MEFYLFSKNLRVFVRQNKNQQIKKMKIKKSATTKLGVFLMIYLVCLIAVFDLNSLLAFYENFNRVLTVLKNLVVFLVQMKINKSAK